MPAKKKNVPKEATARAVLALDRKVAGLATSALHQVATIQQAADYPNQPTVQAAATVVFNDATALDKTVSTLATLRATVTATETTRNAEVLALLRDHGTLVATVNAACKGSAAAVVAWGGKVATHTPAQPSTDAPLGVTVKTTVASGTVEARCKADRTAFCYLWQQGTDPAHPEAWPAPVVVSGAKYEVAGLPPGQKAYFRVALVRRKGGQGQWSGVVEVLVR